MFSNLSSFMKLVWSKKFRVDENFLVSHNAYVLKLFHAKYHPSTPPVTPPKSGGTVSEILGCCNLIRFI